MTTLTLNEFDLPTRPGQRTDDHVVDVSEHTLGRNLPQRIGARLWAPMLGMALMAFPAAVVLAGVRASLIAGADPADVVTIARLQHVTAGVMFIGFAAVFSAITFAIARILGEFRAGGGAVQDAAGTEVQTLRMPGTAKGMLAGMGLAMMLIVVPVVLHLVAAGSVVGAADADLLRAEQWFDRLEAVRRVGVATYLAAIALGLTTILRVLRFQAVRIREIADTHPTA